MTPPCQTNSSDLNMTEPKTDSHFTAIQNFYNGTNIFITGGTGDYYTFTYPSLIQVCCCSLLLHRNEKCKPHSNEITTNINNDTINIAITYTLLTYLKLIH